MKYWFVRIDVRQGERENWEREVWARPDDFDMEKGLDQYLQEYYGYVEDAFKYEDTEEGWYHWGGEIHTSVGTYREIPIDHAMILIDYIYENKI